MGALPAFAVGGFFVEPEAEAFFGGGGCRIHFNQHGQVERQGEVFGRADAALAEFGHQGGANAQHGAEEDGNPQVEEDLGLGVLGWLGSRAEHQHVGLLRLAFEVALHHALADSLVGAAGVFDIVDQHGKLVALGLDGEHALLLLFDGGLEFFLLDGAELVGNGSSAGNAVDFVAQLLALALDLGFHLLHLRMVLAEVGVELGELGFAAGDFGFEVLNQRVLQHFQREFAGAALLPAGGIGLLGLGGGELAGEFVEASGFVVHHALVGDDDAFFLLVGGKPGLGFFEVGAQA